MVIKIGCCNIGIRYPEGNLHLRGCHNDVKSIYTFLQELYGNQKDKFEIDYQILIDTDDKICGNSDNITYQYPTYDNIQNSILKLISGYDYIILSYSGHGSYITDWNGDETDGQDEVICPVDFETKGFIPDDWFRNQFLKKLNQNTKVRILMDCCHSGTIMDLKYKFDINNKYIENNDKLYQLDCDVQALSGCGDSQSSFDVYTAGKFQGAFTNCFIKSFHKDINTKKLCIDINNRLENGGWGGINGQICKYNSSRPILNDDKFLLYVDSNINTQNILNISDANTTTTNNEIITFNNNNQLDLFMSLCSIL